MKFYDIILFSIALITGIFIKLNFSFQNIFILVVFFIFINFYFHLQICRSIIPMAIGICVGFISLFCFDTNINYFDFDSSQNYTIYIKNIDKNCDTALVKIIKNEFGEKPKRASFFKWNKFSENTNDLLNIGETYTCNSILIKINQNTNKFEPNFRRIYYGKNIIGEITDISDIVRVKKASKFDINLLAYKFRNRLYGQLNKSLDPQAIGFSMGMSIGDKSYIKKEDISSIRNFGISHILVVSSLHIGLLILIINNNAKFLGLSARTTEYFIVLILVILYFISLSKISVLKCLFIYFAHMIALRNNRKPFYVLSICIFVCMCLIINPYLIFNLSFVLSVMAYFGVFLVYRYNKFKEIKFLDVWIITIAIYLVLFPIFIITFGGINYLGLFISPIIMPFLESLIALNFVNSFMQFICSIPILSTGLNFLFKVFNMLIVISNNLGDKFLLFPYKNLILILSFYTIVILISIRVKHFNKKLFKIDLCVLVLSFFITVLIHHLPLRVMYLDIGMGDSSIIYQNKTSLIIDGARKNKYRTIKNAMNYFGEDRIDYAILTHAHNDHYGGLIKLMNDDKIGKLYLTKTAYNKLSKKFKVLNKYYNQNRIEFVSGEKDLDIFNGWKIKLFAPNYIDKNVNNNSILCLLKKEDTEFLFMGDAEKREEERMTDIILKNINLPLEYLKVSHHGSKTSSIESFIDNIEPSFAIISVGKNNKYGLPDEEVINRFIQHKTKIHRTDVNGFLEVRSLFGKIKCFKY